MNKRITATLLVLFTLLSFLPTSAMAAEGENDAPITVSDTADVMAADENPTAAADTYNITVTIEGGENGSVSAGEFGDTELGPITGTGKTFAVSGYYYFTLTCKPNAGYKVFTTCTDPNDNSYLVSKKADGTCLCGMLRRGPHQDMDITVTFKPIDDPTPDTRQITVAVVNGEYGDVKASLSRGTFFEEEDYEKLSEEAITETSKVFTVENGVEFTLGRKPKEGYEGTSYMSRGIYNGTNSPSGFYLNDLGITDLDITVFFYKEGKSNVTVNVAGGENGTVATKYNYEDFSDYNNEVPITGTGRAFMVDNGTNFTFICKPNDGYKVSVTGAEAVENEDNTYRVVITKDTVIDVAFQTQNAESTTHKLTFASVADGSVTARVGDTEITSGAEVEAGKIVKLTCTPNEGYEVDTVNDGSKNIEVNPDGTYTVIMGYNDIAVTVTFKPKTAEPTMDRTLTINVGNHGTVTAENINGETKTDIIGQNNVYSVKEDTTVLLTCNPDDGYQVASVTAAQSNATINRATTATISANSAGKYPITIDANTTITITFQSANSGSGGSGGSSGGGSSSSGGSSSRGGSSSSSHSANNATVKPSSSSITGGKVNISTPNAKKGDTVTVTFVPDQGYMTDAFTIKNANGTLISTTKLKENEYSFIMPDAPVTIEPTFMAVTAASEKFGDVAESAYYHNAVTWAVTKGIAAGVSEDRFAPENPCIRAQIVTFLWRAAGSPETTDNLAFDDVASGSDYEKAVKWAVANKITLGTSVDKFSPETTVIRAQAVTFLYRYAGEPVLTDTATSFTDVADGQFYTNAVKWAVTNKIIAGKTESLFAPADDCTCAQIVTFLYRNLAV